MKKAINILLLLITVTSLTVNASAMGRFFKKYAKQENNVTCKVRNMDTNAMGLTRKSKIPEVNINIDIFNTCNSRYRIVYEEHDSSIDNCGQKSTKSNSKFENEESEKSVLLFDGCYDTPTTAAESL